MARCSLSEPLRHVDIKHLAVFIFKNATKRGLSLPTGTAHPKKKNNVTQGIDSERERELLLLLLLLLLSSFSPFTHLASISVVTWTSSALTVINSVPFVSAPFWSRLLTRLSQTWLTAGLAPADSHVNWKVPSSSPCAEGPTSVTPKALPL